MRRHDLPYRLRADSAAVRVPDPPSRKVFNCIVDDAALIAGVKKSTRDGIRKWVNQGAIRLFVPLQTLAQLNSLKNGKDRVNADAKEAIKWLDDITSVQDNPVSGRVQLEGVDEHFHTWAEVAQFMLPETLLSMEESESDEDYTEDMDSSNILDASDECSPLNSPRARKASLGGSERSHTVVPNNFDSRRAETAPKNKVPPYLQPLFNHILWRIHQEANPDAALDNFILLTNDPVKQHIAQRFGIRAKRLEQLRDAVGREDREYKNRMTVYKMENDIPQTASEKGRSDQGSPEPVCKDGLLGANGSQDDIDELADDLSDLAKLPCTNGVHDELSDDEDVVVFTPISRTSQVAVKPPVWDPNEFGRTNQARGRGTPLAPRVRGGRGMGTERGGRGGRGGIAERGGRGGLADRGGRGGFAERGARGGRGGRGGFLPRGNYVPPRGYRAPAPARLDPNQPIDPDSFARPAVGGTVVGGRRKLWEPN